MATMVAVFLGLLLWFVYGGRIKPGPRQEQNLDRLINFAEKEGRLEDAKALRLQTERSQSAYQNERTLSGSDKVSVYRAGTYNQKMALCRALVEKSKELGSYKVSDIDLYNCLEEATKYGDADKLTVAEVSSMCVVLIDKM
ncbi:MAG: hypothetical protein JNL40_02845 [Cyclobacteriaceae bacterium]|nr:hypothetical protein [Cyclobacteriaceae bacterium]